MENPDIESHYILQLYRSGPLHMIPQSMTRRFLRWSYNSWTKDSIRDYSKTFPNMQFSEGKKQKQQNQQKESAPPNHK